MKKVKIEDNFKNETESFFADNFFAENNFENQSLAVNQAEVLLTNNAISRNEEFLDNFLSGIKLIFLYVPGAMMIHFIGMFIYFLILFGLEPFVATSGMIVGLIIGTFLTMFGIGKMNDLNYLKVPASVFTISVLISIIFALITAFTGVEMTGIFLLMSFPITIICGYIVKRFLDKEE